MKKQKEVSDYLQVLREHVSEVMPKIKCLVDGKKKDELFVKAWAATDKDSMHICRTIFDFSKNRKLFLKISNIEKRTNPDNLKDYTYFEMRVF